MNKNKETALTEGQKKTIDEAFTSIATYGTKSHVSVMEETKKKFPYLFLR